MDGFASSNHSRDPLASTRRPLSHHPRTTSKASTSTSTARMAPLTAYSSSSSRVVSDLPQRPASAAHPSHRYHHSSAFRPPTTPRPQSAVPRPSQEPQGQSAVSTFLQERLQKTREEAERNAMARLRQDMAASVDERSRPVQVLPAESASSEGRASVLGFSAAAEPCKKKGMGVKEMEATVSTLHKQNFDLKLELFHRRERQTALEDRLESLEAEKRQMADINDKLLEELEKRDKAVQEAVQMIIRLEAQVEKLVEEREMVRQVEAMGFNLHEIKAALSSPPSSYEKPADLLRLPDETKVVNRMPSFLSDRTENTANLRNVYLGTTQSSLLSSPKVLSDGASDIDTARHSCAMSPSLSVLSESSFVSVYGNKRDRDDRAQSTLGEPLPIDDGNNFPVNADDHRGSTTPRPPKHAASPNRPPRSGSSVSRTSSGSRFQSINDIVDRSPLQRIERLDMSLHGESTSPGNPHRLPEQSQAQARRKLEKREALRRVHTDTPPAGHRQFDQGLPPTPDTISTSTLRRFEASPSTDTLAQQSGSFGGRSSGNISDARPADSTGRTHGSTRREDHGGVAVTGPQPNCYAAAATKRGNLVGSSSCLDDRIMLSHARPRSADDTTVSFGGRGNAWDSDDDDDNEDDGVSIQSLESSLDIWLQQGKDTKQRSGRVSPELFGFPSHAVGWKTRAMVGPGPSSSGEAGFADGAPLAWPDPLEDLVPIQQALFGQGVAPPPPGRRSSLHAQTGPSACTAAASGQGRGESTSAGASSGESADTSRGKNTDTNTSASTNSKLRSSFIRAVRRNSEGGRHKPARLSLPQTTTAATTADAKQANSRAYPPLSRPATSNSTARGRRINSLWRRSLGSTGSAPSPSQPSTTAATDKGSAAAAAPTEADDHASCGTPTWIHRNNVTDDDDNNRAMGATPPPIQRQPQGRRSSVVVAESGGAPVFDNGQAPTTAVTSVATAPWGGGGGDGAPASAEGTNDGGASLDAGGNHHPRRKWIPGFGRTSGLRNRVG